MQVTVVPSWYGYRGEDWRGYVDVESARAYGRFIGERLGRHRNLVWLLGGDNAPVADNGSAAGGAARSRDVRAATRAMAQGIRETEAVRHLMTYHASRGVDSLRHFAGDDWHTVVSAYSGALTLARRRRQPGHRPPGHPHRGVLRRPGDVHPARPAAAARPGVVVRARWRRVRLRPRGRLGPGPGPRARQRRRRGHVAPRAECAVRPRRGSPREDGRRPAPAAPGRRRRPRRRPWQRVGPGHRGDLRRRTHRPRLRARAPRRCRSRWRPWAGAASRASWLDPADGTERTVDVPAGRVRGRPCARPPAWTTPSWCCAPADLASGVHEPPVGRR